jgi:predicted Zn-dependent protease with MMP-like domain
MTRARFQELVAEALDALPHYFRERIHNVVVLVEDFPPGQRPLPGRRRPRALQRSRPLIMGHFIGVPATQKSVFHLPMGPDRVVLYQKNIEAVCHTDAEVREQVRLTLIHELGHYFGLDEDQLRHV